MQPPSPSEPPAHEPSRESRPSMQFVFNAYLICFAADSLLALASPVIGDVPHTFAGFASMCLAMLVILIIGSFRNLPWKPLLIPLLFSLWEGCLFLPLPAFIDIKPLLFTTATAQGAISIWTFLHLRRSSGGERFLFHKHRWTDCTFSMARTCGAAALKLTVMMPMLVGYLLWSGQVMLKKVSKGFILIDTTGLYTEARDYEKDGKVIHLLPTVHVAAPAFYDTLMESLPVSQLVVLPEGVTDRSHLMKARLDYQVAADSVGLSTQPDLVAKRKEPAMQACDADISDFSPATVAVLNGVAGALQAATSGDSLGALQSLSSMQDKDTATVISDIIEMRNLKVLEGVRTALQHYTHVAVPWGAAHMPGIEREVLKMNFRQAGVRRVQVLSWKDLKFSPQR